MVFRRKVVEEDVPTTTPIVTPVAQPVIERNTTVERDSMSGGTAVALILAGLVVIALVWYFAYWQPSTVVATPSSTTIIDHNDGQAAQPIVTPAPVVNTPPVIVNPPASSPAESHTTVVNPPANNSTTVVNPPANTDNTASGETTTPDNNGG
jgi:hypothetical protein